MGVKGDMAASLGSVMARTPKMTARDIVKHVIATADDPNFAQAYAELEDGKFFPSADRMQDYWDVVAFLKEIV